MRPSVALLGALGDPVADGGEGGAPGGGVFADGEEFAWR